MDFTEKLISLVQPNRCLYDCRVKDYKNILKKDALWNVISKELNQSRDTVKSKWKNLKDGYAKYKKNMNGTGQKNSYVNWVWGPYLNFLDGAIQPRATITNYVPNESPNNSEMTELQYSYKVEVEPEILYNGKTEDTGCDIDFNSYDVKDTLIEESQSSPADSPSTTVSRKRKHNDGDILFERIFKYIEGKETKDSVDLLFSSYANSLKRMKPETQASLKIKLAQIFAEAELQDME